MSEKKAKMPSRKRYTRVHARSHTHARRIPHACVATIMPTLPAHSCTLVAHHLPRRYTRTHARDHARGNTRVHAVVQQAMCITAARNVQQTSSPHARYNARIIRARRKYAQLHDILAREYRAGARIMRTWGVYLRINLGHSAIEQIKRSKPHYLGRLPTLLFLLMGGYADWRQPVYYI
jgi:hypothetical protein